MKNKFLKVILPSLVLSASCLVNVANAGLIGYYTFDESSGLTAENSATSGSIHNGSLIGYGANDPTWIAGKFGNALAFNDGGDMVLLNGGSIDINTSWTISAWFQGIAETNTWHTLTRGDGTGDHQVIGQAGDNTLGWYDNTNLTRFHQATSSIFDLDSIIDNDWHHITAVGSNNMTKFFIDGDFVGAATGQSTSNVFAIGNYQGGNQRFADALDDVAIWDEALSDKAIFEIAAGNINPLGEDLTQVPEPSTLAIFALGMIGLASRRFKKQS